MTHKGGRVRGDVFWFGQWLISRHYAATTRQEYVGYVRRFDVFLTAGGSSLRQAPPSAALAFLRSLPNTAASFNLARKALVAFYTFVGEGRQRFVNPMASIEPIPEQKRLPRPIATTERVAFLDALERVDVEHRVVGLAYDRTGCRFSELRRAEWSAFDLRSHDPTWFVIGKGSGRKGPKERTVPLDAELADVLLEWQGAPETSARYLFPARGPSSAPWVSERVIRRLFREVCEAAGIEGVTPHRLRHTAATRWVHATGDIQGAGELLGHEQLSTTQIYTKVLPGRLRRVIEAGAA